MSSLLRDLRFGWRMLFRDRGLTIVVVLSLAAGVGVNATLFALLDALLLRPLPFHQRERVARLFVASKADPRGEFTRGEYDELRHTTRTFTDLVAVERAGGLLDGARGKELVFAEHVSPDYFAALGLRLRAGRSFVQAGDAQAIVISDGLWERQFSRDPQAIGRTVKLSGEPVTIVGVAPRGYRGTLSVPGADVWRPIAVATAGRGVRVSMIGRLAPGVSFRQASAEMETIGAALGLRDAEGRPRGRIALTPETEFMALQGPRLAGYLPLLVGLPVLLIAAINVTAVLMAQVDRRRHELATRAALGAGASHILRQMLSEHLLLALGGMVVCLVATATVLRLLPAVLPLQALGVAMDLGLRVDGRVIGYALALTVAAALACSVVSVRHATSQRLTAELRRQRGQLAGPRRLLGRRALVVCQLALSLVLLTAAALTVRVSQRSLRSDLGFTARELLFANVLLDPRRFDEARARTLYRDLADRMRALPEVGRAALARRAPLSLGGEGATRRVFFPGDDPEWAASGRRVKFNIVEPGYFDLLGVPLLRGRDFTDRDGAGSARVAVVSATTARRFWPGEDPVGRQVRLGDDRVPVDIVGVVGDVVQTRIHEAPEPYVYFPFSQMYWADMTAIVDTRGDPAAAAQALQRELAGIDPEAFARVATLQETVMLSLLPERVAAGLLLAMGGVALLLAAAGLFGVVSYLAARRTFEVGVRMTLGATSGSIYRLVVGQGLSLAVLGVALGLPIALLVGRLVAKLVLAGPDTGLVARAADDPVTYAGVVAILVGVTLAATWWPARRAAKVDPMVALRCE